MKTIQHTYGVRQGWEKGQPRWFVVLDGSSTHLHFAKKEFAIQKSLNFARKCYHWSKDFQGNPIQFEFVREDI